MPSYEDYIADNADQYYGKRIEPSPAPKPEIGLDLDNQLIYDFNAIDSSRIDAAHINALTSVSRRRDELYNTFDAMAEDTMLAAALEIYAEDVTEKNDNGRIVWAESEDPEIQKYINFLLDSFNIDKNIYKWVYSLCKYGDVYLKLFKEDDTIDPIFDKKDKKRLDETVRVIVPGKNEKFAFYVEMIPNPAKMFELIRFGKTAGYIETPLDNLQKGYQAQDSTFLYSTQYLQYRFNQRDVNIYPANYFVHASLEDGVNRYPEEVNLIIDSPEDYIDEEHIIDPKTGTKMVTTSGKANSSSGFIGGASVNYSVKRGQSVLYDVFKTWRQLTLLENSVLLNRVTKSSITRIINVEVGDMPKEKVQDVMHRVKQLIEQKSAINAANSMSDYTNAGPVENSVYMPSYNGKGQVTSTMIGGDSDTNVNGLGDIDYFKTKLYAGLKIPKQYLCLRGDTEILLLNGQKRTLKFLYDHKDEYVGKGIMACKEDGSLDPTVIKDISLTRKNASFIRVHLDNGNYVDVTPDHRMMLRDGSFVEAQNLVNGTSLMPYYDYVEDGRRYVLDNKTGKYKAQYRIVAESVQDIPFGYQVHHLDKWKINDDFDNLKVMSTLEHWKHHEQDLRTSAGKANAKRKALGIPNRLAGKTIINNGIRQTWHDPELPIPEGFVRGTLPFSEEHKKKISLSNKGKKKTYDAAANFGNGPELFEKIKKIKSERRTAGLYDGQFKDQSERMKIWCAEHKDLMSKNSREWHPRETWQLPRTVRCLCCGKLGEVRETDSWYKDYIDGNEFWMCSSDCKKLSGGGKLARSYRLFKSCGCDVVAYDYIRHNGDNKPDTYFKGERLVDIVDKYIVDYVPECNHKVVKIEYLDIIEDAYDISVQSDSHTFALPCGVFVHNCDTDDSTGFNGGTALSIVSSRYAKSITRIQATVIQMLTDLINIILLDRGFLDRVNKFDIKMTPPTTQEQLDRQEQRSSQIALIRDMMDLVSDIEDPIKKLKILKSLLSGLAMESDILAVIQEEIDRLEEEAAPEEEEPIVSDDDDMDINLDVDVDSGGGFNSSFEGRNPIADLTASSEPSSEETSSSETSSSETSLPNMGDLGIDFTDNT